MVAIAPFRALRFDPRRVDLADVTSPPHDCIPPARRRTYLDHAHNIAHIVLAKREGGDAVEQAAEHLAAWETEGVLVRDEAPALYLYEVSERPGHRMRGLLCRLALDPDYKEVRRHERILAGKAEDRFRLRAAIRCDPEPIWLFYKDANAWVEEILWSNAYDELARFTDEDGATHRLWRVDRGEAVGEVVAQFEDRTLVIADGHHRYQTAVDHWQSTGRDEDGAILSCLVRDTDSGIGLVGTHRLLRGVDTTDPVVVRARFPDAEPTTPSLDGVDADHVVLVGRADDGLWALRLHLGTAEGTGLDRLAVTRAHERILRPLGIDPDRPEDFLEFTRDAGEALAAVGGGACDLAVLLPPEDVAAVEELAAAGDVMPQKSTYFVPKLRSGLVLAPLDEPRPRPWTQQVAGPGKRDFRMPPL